MQFEPDVQPAGGTAVAVRPFVVTGCGRSGTLFMARALSLLGHPCGHENLFTPDTTAPPPFGALQGDASWLAAPFVGDLPAGTVVLHQVRHPIDVLRSLRGVRFLAHRPSALTRLRRRAQRYHVRVGQPVANPRYAAFVGRHLPEALEPRDVNVRCARYWLHWNRMVEEAAHRRGLEYVRYRVEDVDAEAFARLVQQVGGTPDPDRIARVVAELGTTTHGLRRVDLDLASVPDASLRAAIAALAGAYGYDLSREGLQPS